MAIVVTADFIGARRGCSEKFFNTIRHDALCFGFLGCSDGEGPARTIAADLMADVHDDIEEFSGLET